MLFNSFIFIFLFLPITLLGWYGLNHFKYYELAKVFLAGMSLWFYGYFNTYYLAIILVSIAVNYLLSYLLTFSKTKLTNRIVLIAGVGFNLGLLFYFKYYDFFFENINVAFHTDFQLKHILLPLGISFFTFQTMSYIIDLYRGEVETEHNYFTYLTYVSMFPQLVAGPIVRFSDIDAELHKRQLNRSEIETGLLRFMQGLFKKVLIANQVGALWEELRILEASQISVTTAWLGAACFTLQLYFDFSAYSDMAIGMGWMLGFHFNKNFNYPLSSISVTDFWRRWHISLSTWFRDYVYIPLGGNRKGS